MGRKNRFFASRFKRKRRWEEMEEEEIEMKGEPLMPLVGVTERGVRWEIKDVFALYS